MGLTASVTPVLRASSEPVVAHVGDDDVSGTGMPDDQRGHDARSGRRR